MSRRNIEGLFYAYFEGTLDVEEKQEVEEWRGLSEENNQLFADSYRVWSGLEQIRRMRKYDS